MSNKFENMVEIIIPVQGFSHQLDRSIVTIQATYPLVPLNIMVEPSLNVSECRQQAMDNATTRYLCFLDHDSEMVAPGWLEEMMYVIQNAPDAVAVYCREKWGDEPIPTPRNHDELTPWVETSYGPAACMLLDVTRSGDVKWDVHMGLRNGWLGPDFEEVQFAHDLMALGGKLYQAQNTWFHHCERTTATAFRATDRARVIAMIDFLLNLRRGCAPDDRDFFKGLTPVAASASDDKMFAPGVINPLRTIFRPVIHRNGLHNMNAFVRRGLV